MIQAEDLEIDRALELCKLIHNDLTNCVNIVQRLSRTYNEPDRYGIAYEVEKRATFCLPRRSIIVPKNTLISTKMSASMLSLASTGSEKMEGRTSHELNAIFVDLKSKCIKLRRELEATAAHAQRVTDCSMRQERVQHRMLRDAQTSETLICMHWGNKLTRTRLKH